MNWLPYLYNFLLNRTSYNFSWKLKYILSIIIDTTPMSNHRIKSQQLKQYCPHRWSRRICFNHNSWLPAEPPTVNKWPSAPIETKLIALWFWTLSKTLVWLLGRRPWWKRRTGLAGALNSRQSAENRLLRL